MGKTTPSQKIDVAILIVNGGTDPANGKWVVLCISKIVELTANFNYRFYVWNNNIGDYDVTAFLKTQPNLCYFQPGEKTRLRHPHASALQLLWEEVKVNAPKYICIIDSDAHPIRKGWLEHLIGKLDSKTVMAGVWRDEIQSGIPP